ncbi:MAG: hypothetical protein Q9219_007345, partial [cf. Caloplaca sp. 3 TL-2023]
MVAISLVRESNEQLRHLPPHLSSPVAVFAGATQGIGLATLRQLAIHTSNPTCYIVGRSEARGQEIINELKDLNGKGKYVFVKGEVSLLKSVDECCKQIEGMVGEGKGLDILYMSQGFLTFGGRNETEEGLDTLLALRYYSRLRFVHNLLPRMKTNRPSSLQNQPLLSRSPNPHVVSVLAAGQESTINEDDLDLRRNYGILACAYHGTTMMSLAFEHLAQQHPDVAFVHAYPGYVRTALLQTGFSWPIASFFKYILQPLLAFFEIPLPDVGDRQLFHATSARYHSSSSSSSSSNSGGVPLPSTLPIAKSTITGAYLLDEKSDSAPSGLTGKLMRGYRERDVGRKVWEHTVGVFAEVCG